MKIKHVVIIHGYILNGTGSNIYTTNLAKTFKSMGLAVTVICQDLQANNYEFVDEYFGPNDKLPHNPPKSCTIRIIIPNIQKLLPVYVYDNYEGFNVKTIPNCTDLEIQQHILMMTKFLYKICSHKIDLVITNHSIFSPVIASRALQNFNIPHICKIHGSSLTFVLKNHPKYKKYAIEGLKSCQYIIAGTKHIENYLYEIFKDDIIAKIFLKEKIIIIPPGMDPEIFKLVTNIKQNQNSFLSKISSNKINNARNSKKLELFDLDIKSKSLKDAHHYLVHRGTKYNQRIVDSDLRSKWINRVIQLDEPVIMYFGKFLNTKGVGEVLVSFPKILKKIPKLRLLLVGFGEYREHLEGMLEALKYPGDIETFTKCALAGDFVDNMDFKKWFIPLTPSELDRITITGYLNHSQLGELLPLASIVIIGSKTAEAFGMVAVEAMACGVLPLSNYHSGLIDCIKVVESVDPELAKIISIQTKKGGIFGFADGAFLVDQLSTKIRQALEYIYGNDLRFINTLNQRKELSKKLRQIVIKKFAWKSISKKIIDLI